MVLLAGFYEILCYRGPSTEHDRFVVTTRGSAILNTVITTIKLLPIQRRTYTLTQTSFSNAMALFYVRPLQTKKYSVVVSQRSRKCE